MLVRDLPLDARHTPRRSASGSPTRLHAPFTLAGAELLVDASVGISLYPDDADDAETLLQHADVAMYEAKGAAAAASPSTPPARPTRSSACRSPARLRRAIDARRARAALPADRATGRRGA